MKANKMKILVSAAFAFCVAALYAELPDPIAWFDIGNATDTSVPDASGNGHALTLGPTVAVVDDPFVGKALKVSGQNTDWASFSCPVVTNMTVAFWMCRDAQDGSSVGTYPYVLNTGFSGYGVNYTKNTSGLAFIDQWDKPTGGTQLGFSSVNVVREVWHHVVITVERTMAADGQSAAFKCDYYVDGAAKVTFTQTATTVHPRAGGIATVCLLNNGKNSDRATSGKFADFRFYSECLTAAEVAEIGTGMQSGRRLVVRYAFDELSKKADGNGRYSTPAATDNTDAMTLGKNMTLVDDGVEGKALRFMSTTEVGGFANLPCVLLKERTVAAWIRSSPSRTNLAAMVSNPYPRFIHDLCAGNGGYAQFSDASGLGRNLSFVPSGCNTSSKVGCSYSIADHDVWCHLAIVERLVEGDEAVADIYVNGVRRAEGTTRYALETVPGSRGYWLGNNGGYGASRWFCGDMDEFRIYNYALSPDEIRRLASGLANVSAGEDFTVAGTRGVLNGTVAPNAADGLRKGYAGKTAWTLVSAPVGGEGAVILQPEAAQTDVVLPVEGSYVFRLTISDLGVSVSDEVTVTCVGSDADNAAPSVSVAASAQAITQPDSVTLTAIVSDDGRPMPAKTRVRWAKKSGPDGVWFDADDAQKTSARFGEAGTYVLTCTADDGQLTTSTDVTIAVADRTDGKDLATDLLHYWSLDGQVNPHFIDPIGKRTDFTAPDYENLRHVPGKVNYGVRAFAYSGTGAYWSTGAASGEVGQTKDASGTAYSGNNPPVNDYLTISAWVYVDPNDPNLMAGNVVGASVVGQSHTLGLRYNEKNGPNAAVNTDGFTLFQQGRNGSDASGYVGYAMVHFPAPNPSPKGRWTHICGILARNASNVGLWEMWYDGVKQTASSTYGNVRGRINTNPLLIGGMNYTGALIEGGKLNANGSYNANWPVGSSMTEFYTRTFPGVVDEVRIWTRKLTPEEIRYLAANPVIGENRGPCVDAPTATAERMVAKESTQVAAVAFADKLPTGGSLTYKWSVVSDNAAFASFGDATSASTTFTASKKGTYVLQLAVSDGERTVCSKPLTVEVTALGLIISIQ